MYEIEQVSKHSGTISDIILNRTFVFLVRFGGVRKTRIVNSE